MEGPNGLSIKHSIRFNFKASNNQAEYEALIVGLRLAKDLGIQRIAAKSNLQLLTSQFNKDYQVKGAVVVHSIEEALKEVEKYPSEDVYCIGGDSIYKQMLPYCNVAHVTKIDFAYEADAHFPNLDEDPEWEITAESDEQTYFDLEYVFVKYERKNK